ncbi:WYL domain-containing protein [Maritalea mobilis]|uniref:helix-turn-helix transcriptional regulator n=1 Tax=Maritalea mobilis TaxID=483324 RepID=UPI001C972214|nr:WYL domain-containing protein [Maritalea mobilis]MBY6201046.1 WYL domain-containing protein [Maritalea mobilis]
MSRRKRTGPRWSAEKRYEFIEFRLFWTGRLNRSDLIEAFSLSTQQASIDINTYLEGRKSNLTYDKQAKCYRRGKAFKPRYYEPDAAGFLAQVRAVEDGLVAPEQSWIAVLPDFAGTPVPARGVDPSVLRDVYTAIVEGRALSVTYQSMSRPEPGERVIEPHALAFDGFRWHARAFCLKDAMFKDFVLSRMLDVEVGAARGSSPEEDVDWLEEVVLEIGPHPDLSDAQKRVFEMDYGMTDGVAKIPVRRALLYYALKRLGLDTDPGARSPQDQQIVLLNGDAVRGGA